MSSVPATDSQLVDQARHEIRGLVHEIEQLVQRDDCSVGEFYREFLGRVVAAMGAVGGVIWSRGEEGLRAEHQVGLSEGDLGDDGDARNRHAKLLQSVVRDGRPLLSQPFSVAGDDDAGNPTAHLLLVTPIKSDREIVGILEVFQRPAAGAVTQRGYMRFASQMAGLASDFHKSHRLRQFDDRQTLWQQWNQFARSVHASLDPRRAAFALANEGRRLLDCDRVSVLLPTGASLQWACVSGQEILDVRAGLVKHMRRLAQAVAATGEDLWFDGKADDFPPQIEQSLHAYIDDSHAKTLAVLPLIAAKKHPRARPELLGVVVVEYFQRQIARADLADKVAVVREHGAGAIANAREHDSLFLLPLWKALGKSRALVAARNLPKTVAALSAAAGAALALVLVPADFTLEARGVAQPVERREVFASGDGIVMQVNVRHGEVVEEGKILVELQDAELESRLTALRGEYSSKLARYTSVRNLSLSDKKLSEAEKVRLKGEGMELEESLHSIQSQLQLAEEKRKQLAIPSPIAGEVVTWNVHDLLIRRPVNRGDALLSVANPDGEWELELRMPEDRMGHLVRQAKDSKEPLAVSYIVATAPGASRQGVIQEIHEAAEVRGEDGNTVLVKVNIDKGDLVAPRPGAEVTAKVHCGQRSIGYVWFHDLIAFVQSKILFRL